MNHTSEIEMVIVKIMPWCNSREEAEKWCSSVVIPALGGTAEEMVRLGKFKFVVKEIERMAVGGFT